MPLPLVALKWSHEAGGRHPYVEQDNLFKLL
jgi:hypothetical protein